MKRFGILVSIFVILSSLGAMWVSSKLVLARNHWSRRVADARIKAEKSRDELARLEKEVSTKKEALRQAEFGWERYWPVVPVERRQPGALRVGLGTQQGVKKDDVVYMFQPTADGTGFVYVGPFKVSNAAETECAAVPFWRFRQGDDANWRPSPNWRVRTNIPKQFKTSFTTYEAQFLVKDEAIASQQEHLAVQQENKAGADRHLQLRLKELSGDPDLEPKKGSLDKFVVEGLHKAVGDAEVDRDAVQAEVDSLRRQLKQTRDAIERVKQENSRLANGQEAPTRTAAKGSE